MIEVDQLVKRYGNSTALHGISFTAQHGQVTGFLGPNGAGKTTTMRILTGYLPPTEGHARVAGHDVFDDSVNVRRKVGYLPENVPLYRDMTALGYLEYMGELRGLPQRRKRAMDALERVNLGKRAHSPIRSLSKGMRQRVGLAQALLHDPAVLILDEPTIGLDPLQVAELRNLVRELGRDHTLIFSTHILSEAEQVCDKVIIINQGRIVAAGAPQALRADLERGGRILVRLESHADDPQHTSARLAVARLDGVADVAVEGDQLIVTPLPGHEDVRADIARTIIENGWELLELRALATDLETIFLEVTRGTAPAVPTAHAAAPVTTAAADDEETTL